MESYIIACYRAYIIEPFKLHQKNPVSRATKCLYYMWIIALHMHNWGHFPKASLFVGLIYKGRQ